ncbi:secondary thiamine-phosphate synthase enzyme YjbQ [Acidomonas methanolica]|uniref:secondary thiamine-phosphate synthase enzyme YjbQ n=1 Tax=Acidomonas methanolica TaxID=437 RepID=UPI002119DF68|nr:secondary thiamine-phosphate synthase enzyme YjbQ [Acidomonas methanolica]MCQ9156428.1 YjbQ family protein [Acidomonas methanolica]
MSLSFSLTTERNGLLDITDAVQTLLKDGRVEAGIVLVSVPHSTASITVTSPWDPLALEDVDDELRRLIPTRVDFKHQHDTPQDAAGHVKAAIVGHSRTLIVENGQMALGHSQRLYFWEFDAPRTRHVEIQLVACR